MPASQQPGPLLSFGQRILDKNQTQLFLFGDDVNGARKHMIDVDPSIIYGVTDDFSIFFNVPIAASFKENKYHAYGLEDIFLQLEYAFYANKSSHAVEQATIVTNITFPTGSTKKQPPTGIGSQSFFLGATFNRTYVNWFGFTSHGVLLTTSHHGIKAGNSFLYEFGIGRNIFNINSEWIFAGLIEIDGVYTEKSKIKNVFDPNSGGNIIYITPSLWLSSENVIMQFGCGFPIVQHLFGSQIKSTYLLSASLGWTF